MQVIKEENKAKLVEVLSKVLGSSDIDQLKWFIKANDDNNTKLFDSENILQGFWTSFERLGANDEEIIQNLISKVRSKVTLGKLFADLIRTKDETKYTPTLNAMIKNPDYWSTRISSPIIDACFDVGLEIDDLRSVQLYEIVIKFSSGTISDKLTKIEEKVLPWISDGDQNKINNGLKILELICHKQGSKLIRVNEVSERVREMMNSNNVNAKSLLDYLFNNVKDVSPRKRDSVIDVIREQLVKDKPPAIITLALKYVPAIIDNFSAYDILKEEIIELAISGTDESVKNVSKDLLRKYKNRLTSKNEKIIKDSLGEEFFKT